MLDFPSQQITKLLVDWSNGDESALSRLIPIVYEELRRMARMRMRQERQGHTLDPTALVHEAFMCLANCNWFQAQMTIQFMYSRVIGPSGGIQRAERLASSVVILPRATALIQSF